MIPVAAGATGTPRARPGFREAGIRRAQDRVGAARRLNASSSPVVGARIADQSDSASPAIAALPRPMS